MNERHRDQELRIFMEIEVEFFTYLADYSPMGEKKIKLLIEDGATLKDLCERLDIPPR